MSMSTKSAPPLISTHDLAARLGVTQGSSTVPASLPANLKLFDCSWLKLPVFGGRDAYKEFVAQRIPGAMFVDIDEVADQSSPYPHMLPSPMEFSEHTSRLGVQSGDYVVCYDSIGIFSAPRLWWMFHFFGLPNVSVLDGGLKKWLSDGYPTDDSPPAPLPSPAPPLPISTQAHMLRSYEDINANIDNYNKGMTSGVEQMLDARPLNRFEGKEPEPRPNLPSGHMPHSKSLFFGDLVTPEGPYKDKQALMDAFNITNVDLDKPIVCSCGSGVSAAIIALALELVGKREGVAVYDGSWTEWKMRQMDEEKAATK
ncbi:unnamed protein product [Vitrella brassicaformis CCMP3155]|uniref:Sulfurtransferase n=2 Tax=Vitrella brassicaformis TaxID=1169539 RepID=A0A0G4EGR3_VITBC|nr:unnamed protein product [Vitrella brassicaformis CCMP3155]|eukprot:CEL94690.1 unnamed protein product [Vitrella brassicaformis CCMP3155]